MQGIAETRGLSARMLRAANEVNTDQRMWTIRQLQSHFKTLFGRRVGLLGLSFKPNTDDLRNPPALEIASQLARANVQVRAVDPAVKAVPVGSRTRSTCWTTRSPWPPAPMPWCR